MDLPVGEGLHRCFPCFPNRGIFLTDCGMKGCVRIKNNTVFYQMFSVFDSCFSLYNIIFDFALFRHILR